MRFGLQKSLFKQTERQTNRQIDKQADTGIDRHWGRQTLEWVDRQQAAYTDTNIPGLTETGIDIYATWNQPETLPCLSRSQAVPSFHSFRRTFLPVSSKPG